jgi:hypothetical protein
MKALVSADTASRDTFAVLQKKSGIELRFSTPSATGFVTLWKEISDL